jgi:ribose transport system permease protein
MSDQLAPGSAATRRGFSPSVIALLALPALVVVVIIGGAVTTTGFLTVINLQSILRSASIVGIVATGMAFVTLGGRLFSLGIQQTAMVAAMIFGLIVVHRGLPVGVGLLVVLLVVLAGSIVQGLLIAAGINPIVLTLATGTIVYGAVSYFTANRAQSVTFVAPSLNWATESVGGVPVEVALFAAVVVIASIVHHRLVIGRQITLVGANQATARLSGLSIRSAVIWSFIALGAAAALGGVLSALLVGQATATMQSNLTSDVITAVLIGGVAIEGGRGAPALAAMGAIFVSIIDDIILLNGFSSGAQQLVSGAILVGAVILMHVSRGSTA